MHQANWEITALAQAFMEGNGLFVPNLSIHNSRLWAGHFFKKTGINIQYNAQIFRVHSINFDNCVYQHNISSFQENSLLGLLINVTLS